MIPSSAGSTAVTNPRVTAQMKFEYRIWMVVIGVSGRPTQSETKTERPCALLMGVLTRRTLRRLSQRRGPA